MKLKRKIWIDLFYIPFQYCNIKLTGRVIMEILSNSLPVIKIFSTTYFINIILSSVGKSKEFSVIIIPFLFICGIIILENLCSAFINLLNQKIEKDFSCRYQDILIEKCAKLRYTDVENPQIWDLIYRVKEQSVEKLQKGIQNLIGFSGLLIQIFGYLAILFFYIPSTGLVILCAAVPVIIISMKCGSVQYETQRNISIYKRQYQYFDDILTKRDSLEERKIFSYFPFIRNKWKLFFTKSKRAEKKIVIKSMVRMKLISSGMVILVFFIAFALFFPLKNQIITAGLYISLIQAANNLVHLLSWVLSDYVNELAVYKEYIKDVEKFMMLAEDQDALTEPSQNAVEIETIEFRNVSFGYKENDPIIKNLNCVIEKGQHYAIVGRNGAGKTTFVKLLTGLYTDFDGDILINGVSVRTIKTSDRKSMISVLFQDFVRYEISMYENIAIGNINTIDTEQSMDDINRISDWLNLNNLYKNFSDGMSVFLGKLKKEGIDLSGGQWQRIALARSVISPASLMILDEPTSSLDPVSESRIYEEFNKISRGKTTLFITHRLASVKLADRIFVLDHGKLIQDGTHEELMSTEGLYREMYESQKGWYTDE